jgi:uncharacterized coiled-coil DUF342 family protein
MADTFTLLKEQFASLCQQRDAIIAATTPLRAQRDAIRQQSVAALDAQTAPLTAQIVAAESGLADLHNQIAMISNALGGKTAL